MAGIDKNNLKENYGYFLTLPDEQLVLAERKHKILIIYEIIIALFLTLGATFIAYSILLYYLHSPSIFIAVFLVIFCTSTSLIAKIIIDWYLHIYIITNKKILEVYYSPLFFYKTSGVQLNQVRCTEIDEKRDGIINEILDKGDVILTFDRPTHQEEFVLTDIRNPRQIALTLSNMFARFEPDTSQPIWYKMPRKTNIPPFSKQIFGGYSFGGR